MSSDSNVLTQDIFWNLSDLATLPKNGLKVFSTFSCGGGSSMGYKLAGCEVLGANDIDEQMSQHYKRNLNPKYYYLCPVKELVEMELPDELFNLDILDGSPPCSSFSVSGNRESDWGKKKYFREGQAKQVLDDLFFDYLNLVGRLKPKVAIAENVKGMLVGKAKGYTKLVFNRFKEIGYKPQIFLVNSADCGVPQKRERVFFCALRSDINRPKLILKPNYPWINAGKAIADIVLSKAESDWAFKVCLSCRKAWEKAYPGERFKDTFIRLMGNENYLFNHARLSPLVPSRTLTSQANAILHWSECRKFCFREWKRFASFPDDYWAESDEIGCYLVGMSVPPRMMATVARAVVDQWLG